MQITITLESVKSQANALKDYLKQANAGISHSACLHAIAKIYGFENWNTFCATLKNEKAA